MLAYLTQPSTTQHEPLVLTHMPDLILDTNLNEDAVAAHIQHVGWAAAGCGFGLW